MAMVSRYGLVMHSSSYHSPFANSYRRCTVSQREMSAACAAWKASRTIRSTILANAQARFVMYIPIGETALKAPAPYRSERSLMVDTDPLPVSCNGWLTPTKNHASCADMPSPSKKVRHCRASWSGFPPDPSLIIRLPQHPFPSLPPRHAHVASVPCPLPQIPLADLPWSCIRSQSCCGHCGMVGVLAVGNDWGISRVIFRGNAGVSFYPHSCMMIDILSLIFEIRDAIYFTGQCVVDCWAEYDGAHQQHIDWGIRCQSKSQ